VTKEVRMDGDTYPPIVKWVSVSEKKHKKKTSDMIFSEDEIRAMLPFAYTPRDKGFLYCLFQSGARDGEFLNMKVDDVKFDKYGALLTLRVSKTIPRTVRIVESAKELGAWLNVHPQKNNGDAWLWINVKGEPMTPFNARKVLNDIAERAQITKKIYPHILRHSCATIKGKWMNVLQLQKFFGWSEGSKEAGTYCHLTDLDVGNIELEHRGIKEKQDSKLREVIVNCPNCGKICGAQDTHCLTCGLPLNTHASDTIAELTKQVKYLTSWVSDMKLKQIVKEEGGLH
jgi:integrase